jgi:hypothetical protein
LWLLPLIFANVVKEDEYSKSDESIAALLSLKCKIKREKIEFDFSSFCDSVAITRDSEAIKSDSVVIYVVL